MGQQIEKQHINMQPKNLKQKHMGKHFDIKPKHQGVEIFRIMKGNGATIELMHMNQVLKIEKQHMHQNFIIQPSEPKGARVKYLESMEGFKGTQDESMSLISPPPEAHVSYRPPK